jgi:hypothetical protein
MRASLKQSLRDSPAGSGEGFRSPKGSIVICNACAVPMAKLDYGIALADKAGKMASAFKPLTSADLDTLAHRQTVDAGVRAWVLNLTPESRAFYLSSLREFRAGDPMVCPVCQSCFAQVLSVEKDEVLDKAYVIELLTIPPDGTVVPIRGKHIGTDREWIHEGAELIG